MIQQPCDSGFNITSQVYEPKDLTRPAILEVDYIILYKLPVAVQGSYSIRFLVHLAKSIRGSNLQRLNVAAS